MFCERCGNPVGESEKFCSQCGAPLPEMEPAATSEAPTAPEAAAESVSAETEATAAAESVSAEAEVPAAAESVSAAPVPLSVPQVQEAPIASAIPEDKPDVSGKKPKKRKAPFIIAACAVVAVVAICVAVVAGLGDFFRRTFSSPEEYYRYVERNTVSTMARMGGAYYDMLIAESLNTKGRSTDIEFAVELGEGGQELLEMADIDLTWLKGFSVDAGYSLKDYLLGYNFTFGLNKSDILSLKTISDLEKGTMYLQLPELTADYICFDLDEITDGEWTESLEMYGEMQETLTAVQKAMPDTKDVEKLLQKYMELALNSVSDVEKSTKTIKAGGVQQKCTELTVTFDGKSLSKIMEAVLKEIPKDKDLKKLYVGMVESLQAIDGDWSIDGEEAWDEFIKEVEELLDRLDELEDLDDGLVMKVYVDGKGKIVGRVLEMVEDRETYGTISILAPEKGSKFGYEFSVQSAPGYGGELALTGSGKKSGEKLTGDFELKYSSISVLDMKVSELDMSKGYLNGSITMTLSKQIASLLSTSMSYYGADSGTMLTDMEVTLDFQMAENSDKITLELNNDGENIVSISMSAETGDGSGVSVPDAKNTVFVEDEEGLENWLKNLDWDNFIEKLDKAGLPDEVVDTVEEISGFLAGGDLPDGLYGLDDDYLFDDYFNDYDDDHYGDDHYDDDYGDDHYGDDHYGDDHYGDDHYGDDHYGDDHYGDDHNNSDDTYGGSQWDDDNSLEQLLQSDEWQSELKSWNDSVSAMGITVDTVADGNILVFEYYLPDEAIYNAFGETEGSLMADAFLGALQDEDFLQGFGTGYGIWLDGVRCVVFRADGTEIYSDEIRYEY
ncbi:MAG: DUF4854 domain-containing protein [Acetatifactor sp.]|nr:DUF4854 domain-containing protein [Acetatifactor sp.]